MRRRWIAVAIGVVALVAIFLVVRPRDEAGAPGMTGSSGTPSERREEDGGNTIQPSQTTPAPEALELEIEVEDGKVQGPDTATVKVGDGVDLVVEADVSDEVHVHGYDLTADVTPSKPARMRFEATTAGVFEIELESAGLLLVRLQVEP